MEKKLSYRELEICLNFPLSEKLDYYWHHSTIKTVEYKYSVQPE